LGVVVAGLSLAFPAMSLAQPAEPSSEPVAPPPPEPQLPNYPPPGFCPAPGYYLPPSYCLPPGYYPPPGYPLPPGYYAPPSGTPNGLSTKPYDASPDSTPVIAAAHASPVAGPTRRYSVGATLAGSFDGESGSNSLLTSPLIGGAYAVHPRVFIDLVLGFGWLVDNQGLGESTFRAGNPQLSGTYQHTRGPWSLRGSLGVTAPLAHVPLGLDGRLYRSVYNRALAAWGMWNQWLWYADRMAVPWQLRASYRFQAGPAIVAELDPALVFGATHGAKGTDFVGQLAIEARFPLGSIFVLCPRLQTVLLPRSSIDALQSAAGLRGVFVTRLGRFFASILFNLDQPLSAVSGDQRWGFHIGKEMDL
jgi:hypothetical protein